MPMEVDVLKNIHDDRMSDCRSLGSCYHPSSQSRKISIGMMVDHIAKRRSGASNEHEVVEPNAERMKPSEENNSEGRKRTEGIRDAIKRKKIEAPEKPVSPWVSTRSFNEKSPLPETIAHARSSTSLGTKGKRRKLNAAKDGPVNYSVQLFTNQISMAHSCDGKGKKFSGDTYQSTGERDGSLQRVEEFTFATAHNVTVSDERVVEGSTDKLQIGRTETLRMKLSQILGTVSSPKRQASKINKEDGNILKQKQIFDQNGDTVVDRKGETSGKPKQNSDSIETDSEIADQNIKRPVTRSFTRKKTKVRHLKTEGDPSSTHRQKYQENNLFSSKRGWSHKLDGVVNGGSSASLRKMYQKRSSKIEPRKIYFPKKNHIDEIPRETYKSEISFPSERPSPLCNTEDAFPAENQRETNKIGSQVDIHSSVVPENGVQHKDTGHPFSINIPDPQDEFQSPAQTVQMEKGVLSPVLAEKMFSAKNFCSFQNLHTSKSDFYGSNDDAEEPNSSPPRKPAPGNEIQHEDVDHPFLINIPDPRDEFLSLTFKIKTPNSISSPVSRLKTVQVENDAHSPALAKKRSSAENIQSFWTLRTSKPYHYEPDAESSDDAEETKGSPPRKAAPVKERKFAADSFYESSSEEGDYESSKESPSRGFREGATFSPATNTVEKLKFTLGQTKNLRNLKDFRANSFSPTSPSPKDIGESEWIQEPLEEKQEDELARVVKLFALALENIKRKIQSATRKKSNEILMSVSEEVHQQLQNIELQIQTDVNKLTSLSKSKRKLLETKLQEQQGELKSMHEKFQEVVCQHLQDCESTLEGLEANQIELKGIMKKQKALNQKLLLQVGSTVESHVNDAQRRIAAVHKSARKQMLQLKHVIADCFPEDS